VKLTVLGAGAWGTALALVLHRNGRPVTLWGHSAEHLEDVRAPRATSATCPASTCRMTGLTNRTLLAPLAGAEVVVMAVPSKALREVAKGLGGYTGILLSVTKGIEHDSGLTMCGVLRECAPRKDCRAQRTVACARSPQRKSRRRRAASEDAAVAQTAQSCFIRRRFGFTRAPTRWASKWAGR